MKPILVSRNGGRTFEETTCSANSVAWLNLRRSKDDWVDPISGYIYRRKP